MKAAGTILATVTVALIGIGVIWSLQNWPHNPQSATGNDPHSVNPFPTFTSTPVPFVTPTLIPTRTPAPTITPIPTPQNWNHLVESAHRILRDDLMRYHRDHVGKNVYFEGIAMQVTGTDDFLGVLLAVAEGDEYDYGGNVFLQYQNAPIRVMQSDWIEVVGRFIDLHTYQSVGAGQITVPLIEVIELNILDE